MIDVCGVYDQKIVNWILICRIFQRLKQSVVETKLFKFYDFILNLSYKKKFQISNCI